MTSRIQGKEKIIKTLNEDMIIYEFLVAMYIDFLPKDEHVNA